MKSLARLSLLLIAGASPAVAQEPPAGDGPRGTSQGAPGEVRYDAVGYAGTVESRGLAAVSGTLVAGDYAEVTALDSGRTIVVAVIAGEVARGKVAMLSDDAGAALGSTGDAVAIRIRKVTPTPQDIVQLRNGQAASFRAEAPAALLVALRKKLPAAPQPVARSIRPTPRPRPAPVAATPPAAPAPAVSAVPRPTPTVQRTAGYIVQVAALSSADRAAAVARAVGGSVIAGPPVWRVRLGPYPDAAAAGRAKADAARKGYSGGQITRIP